MSITGDLKHSFTARFERERKQYLESFSEVLLNTSLVKDTNHQTVLMGRNIEKIIETGTDSEKGKR